MKAFLSHWIAAHVFKETFLHGSLWAGQCWLTMQYLLVVTFTFANRLGPIQDRQNIGPDSGSRLFDTIIVFLKACLERVNLKK